MAQIKSEIGIGMIGLGTVGSGVYQLLKQNEEILAQRTGKRFVVQKICVRDPKKKRSVSVPSALVTTNPDDVLNDPKVQVVVELMGGVDLAEKILLKAAGLGKNIVTANKALLAQKGSAIFKAAYEKGVHVGFEASVAGGIPILKVIREGLIGNRIGEVYGIINGTSNFILSQMTQRGEDFDKVLQEAQKEGYAEADPTFDIKGVDAAQKLAILISLCYGVWPSTQDIYVEGIDRMTPLDIEFAKKLGYVIKLLAIAKDHGGKMEARVHPTMIPQHHPLSDVSGVFNAIFLKGDAVGETMFLGRGAGMMPTASAVVSDIAMVSQGSCLGEVGGGGRASIQPMSDLRTEYYLRFSVVDQPGVLAQIAKHLGDHEISIANVYQQQRLAGSKVPIVVLTHEAREKDLFDAIKKIDRLEAIRDATVVVRVEKLINGNGGLSASIPL